MQGNVTKIPSDFCCGNTTLNGLDLSTRDISVIGPNCFRYLHSLTYIRFSKNLASIGYGSFFQLISLQLINLSNCINLRVIEENTFVGAHSLQGLFLPEGLVEIGPGALRELMILENLTIPASVTTISPRAFNRCSRLRNVILKGQPNIDPNAFKGCHPRLTFVHQSFSEVEGCRLQPGQAAAGGGEMEVAVGAPSMHPDSSSLHQSSSKVEGCRLQPRQAAAGGGVMGVVVGVPSMHPDLPSLLQSSSEVEGCRLQPGQAAAGGGEMRVAVDVGEPSMHPDSPFRFPCYIGKYDVLKGKLQFGQADEGVVCQISYEEFVAELEIVILPCGHAFSVSGMSDWYKNKKICPSCNAVLQ